MYNFFIDGVQYPIAPSEITTKINGKSNTITLINEGEVNILKKPGLTDIKFELLLPNVNYPFAVYPSGFRNASFYLEKLEQLITSQKPFQFIINRMMPNGNLLFDTNMTVSIEDYEINENAENGFDISVSINLKQYRPYGNKKVEIKETPVTQVVSTKKATVQKQRDTSSKKTPKTHKVQPGDTLWAIAKRYLDNGSRYPELASLNKLKDPNKIYPGQVIRLE